MHKTTTLDSILANPSIMLRCFISALLKAEQLVLKHNSWTAIDVSRVHSRKTLQFILNNPHRHSTHLVFQCFQRRLRRSARDKPLDYHEYRLNYQPSRQIPHSQSRSPQQKLLNRNMKIPVAMATIQHRHEHHRHWITN